MTEVAVLGCGMISGAYAPTIAEFDHLDLVACADLDPARATEVAERHGIPQVPSIEELLAHPTVEVIVNLTPASAHEAVIRSILEAGKHAFSEKPLGVDRAGAGALVDLAAERGLALGLCAGHLPGHGTADRGGRHRRRGHRDTDRRDRVRDGRRARALASRARRSSTSAGRGPSSTWGRTT